MPGEEALGDMGSILGAAWVGLSHGQVEVWVGLDELGPELNLIGLDKVIGGFTRVLTSGLCGISQGARRLAWTHDGVLWNGLGIVVFTYRGGRGGAEMQKEVTIS
ncbi:hypothetical protein CK203_033025 [Vitis vinifera]|uniref:Uncharacterized protein n=1 Tax=Vitis vinifera TaxID=29760 RepID=A0A438HVS2_VITVI|nr:hypothetical protein CK203_033025 [Vitis vinifera]